MHNLKNKIKKINLNEIDLTDFSLRNRLDRSTWTDSGANDLEMRPYEINFCTEPSRQNITWYSSQTHGNLKAPSQTGIYLHNTTVLIP